MALRRKTLIEGAVEAREGVAETTVAGLPVLARPTVTPSDPAIVRELAKASLTPDLGVQSFHSCSAQFQIDCMGNAAGTPGANPPFDAALRACGMQRLGTLRVPIGAVTGGPIPSGTRFTQTSASTPVRGICVGTIVNGDSHAFLHIDPVDDPTNFEASEALNFDNGGAATPSSTGSAAVSYRPASIYTFAFPATALVGGGSIQLIGETIFQDQGGGDVARGVMRGHWRVIDGDAALSDWIYAVEHTDGTPFFNLTDTLEFDAATGVDITPDGAGAIVPYDSPSLTLYGDYEGTKIGAKGARGTFTLRMRNGDRAIFEFDFSGGGILPADGSIGVAAADGALPPPLIGGSYLLGDTYAPKWSEIAVNIGNTVELRECADDSTGYLAAIVGNRQPQITMDPELVRDVVFPMLSTYAYEKSSFRSVFAWGGGAENGNNFVVECPQTQVNSPGIGERATLTTLDATMPLSGPAPGDNEFILHNW